MDNHAPGGDTPIRTDFLVSVAVVGVSWRSEDFSALEELAQKLRSRFQFWELIAVIPVSYDLSGDTLDTLRWIQNIRILRVDNVDNFYRLRLVAASEAIGDVVVLTTTDELPSMDLPELAREAYDDNAVVIMTRKTAGLVQKLFFSAMGRLTGYRIESNDTLTAGFPRTWLSPVLGRPQAEILLRFETRTTKARHRRMPVPQGRRVPRRIGESGRRIRLLMDLVSSAAPRILQAIAVLSLFVTVLAVVYGIYATLIWLFKDNVVEGWLTTSLIQVMIASFLGISLAAIAMGIVKIFDRLDESLHHTIIDEQSNVDFFSEVKDLNIEMGKALTENEGHRR